MAGIGRLLPNQILLPVPPRSFHPEPANVAAALVAHFFT
jgi:hypothetical protein